jgi:hypothetical protein
MLWILLTTAAAPLQVARNALQRGLVGDAGPWGATLVRFLFGLPFSLALFMVVAALTPHAAPDPSLRFLVAVAAGAVAQVCATAALLDGHAQFRLRRGHLHAAVLPAARRVAWLFRIRRPDERVQWWASQPPPWRCCAVMAVAQPGDGQAGGSPLRPGVRRGLRRGAERLPAAGLALEPAHPIYSATARTMLSLRRSSRW